MGLTPHIEADWTPARKVAVLQQFLGEAYFHESGMMYSHWRWAGGEARPWREEDFAGQSVPRTSAGFTRAGYAACENSAWVSGLFLWSQCLRYQATGEEEALVYAARAFGSLDANFRLGEAAGERGYLCKPYDWSLSRETSPDQTVAAMLGMWAYRPLADRATQRRIDELLPALADWWRERDYTIAYFERRLCFLDDAYHAPTMACLHALAYQVSGDRRYLDECRRLLTIAGPWATRIDVERGRMLAEAAGQRVASVDIATAQNNRDLGDAAYDPSRRPFIVRNTENRAAMWMMVAAADCLLRYETSLAGLLQLTIARHYQHCQLGLRSDLLSHYVIQIDLERDVWRPLVRPPTPERVATAERLGLSRFAAYDSEVCWGDAAARIADIAVIGRLRAPMLCAGALSLARALLTRLDDQRLHWMIDPDGRQLLPELRWMGETLSSDVPVFTVLTYWRARCAGIEL